MPDTKTTTIRKRLERLRLILQEANADAFLVTGYANKRYLSGFPCEAGTLVVTLEDAYLITDGRFREEAEEGSPVAKVTCQEHGETLPQAVAKLAKGKSLGRLLGEEDQLSVKVWNEYKTALGDTDFSLCGGTVEGLRAVKDESEIGAILQAAQAADAAFAQIQSRLTAGATEADLSLELERGILHARCEKAAFDFIVASGTRASRPHANASLKKLETGDLVILDFGGVWDGYHSDITRTILVGDSPHPRQIELYLLVRQAQAAALEIIRPGIKAQEADAAARRVLDEAGVGESFVHSTGHGVGLEIHEGPRLGPKSEAILEEGMVVTVEPGVYLPGWGGIRLEDTIVIRANGPEILTHSPKELLLASQGGYK